MYISFLRFLFDSITKMYMFIYSDVMINIVMSCFYETLNTVSILSVTRTDMCWFLIYEIGLEK